MKTIFFGTPEFSIPSLKAILDSNHEVVAVVTAPDKPKGRGRKLSVTPVKAFALEHNIPVLQPEKLKDDSFVEDLKKFPADIFVIVAFRILPERVFNLPEYGSFNLHGSLLPKYRGAAPMQWALINGDTETGVTTFKLKQQVDTGNIYLKKSIPIDPEENLEALHDKMSEIGAEAVIETLDMIESGNIQLLPQDDSHASPAPKITKETCFINWNKSAIDIKNLVRGLSPVPGAYFEKEDKVFKVFKVEVVERSLAPGEMVQTDKELIVGCAENAVRILEIQQEGRKRMDIEAFLRGFRFTLGNIEE